MMLMLAQEATDWAEKARQLAEAYGPRLVVAIIVFVVGYFAAKLFRIFVERILKKARWDESLTGFIGNLTYMAAMTFVVITALGKLGIETGSFIAVVGAAGLAVGFALQNSLSNFASGVLLVIFKPFGVGDYIEGAGTAGTVQKIQIFCTVLLSPDNKTIVVPNSSLTSGNITNFSRQETRRVDMVFGIGYGDDLRYAKEVLQGIIQDDERVLKDPEPVVAVSELADSSVNFVVRPWVKTEDYWAVYFDIHQKVKTTFDEKGISIPYPQRDVHMHNN